MIREFVGRQIVAPEPGFRWRGREVTRLEAFSDAVFAFAVTLIVVSLEVPKTFAELLAALKGIVAFAICFAILVHLWHTHYIYSRRYGLQTPYSVLLNSLLLFVVLFFVYPLKFLFTLATGNFMGAVAARGPAGPAITAAQVPELMVVFSLGYMTVFGVFTLMYHYAYSRRDELELNEYERLRTRHDMYRHAVVAASGALVALAAEALPAGIAFLSIFLTLLAPLYRIRAKRSHREAERLAFERATSSAT